MAVCRALEQQRAKKITKVFELTSAIKIEAELNLLCQVLAAIRRSSEGGIHWERWIEKDTSYNQEQEQKEQEEEESGEAQRHRSTGA